MLVAVAGVSAEKEPSRLASGDNPSLNRPLGKLVVSMSVTRVSLTGATTPRMLPWEATLNVAEKRQRPL
eukprot:scaffold11621_cov67-Phaeocystis_antarctica.AAC.5